MVEYYEDYTIMQFDNFIIDGELVGINFYCDVRINNFDMIDKTINFINLN